MRKWSWYREGWGGLPNSHWESVIREAGYPSGDEDFHGHDAELGPGEVRGEKAFPDLAAMLLHMQPGDRLGIGDFGMLAAKALWSFAAQAIADKGITLEDCSTRFVLDLSKPGAFEAGYGIAIARRDNVKATAPARKGKLGRPRELKRAYRLFIDI